MKSSCCRDHQSRPFRRIEVHYILPFHGRPSGILHDETICSIVPELREIIVPSQTSTEEVHDLPIAKLHYATRLSLVRVIPILDMLYLTVDGQLTGRAVTSGRERPIDRQPGGRLRGKSVDCRWADGNHRLDDDRSGSGQLC